MALGAGGGGLIGFIVGKITPGDMGRLADKCVDGVFGFLRQQGTYASFAIVMTVGFGWLAVWSIRQLIQGKQGEIDRIASDRDKFQQLVIETWQSSSDKGGKKSK